jgi:glycosyltransferase involved in cell wall biosynthesis
MSGRVSVVLCTEGTYPYCTGGVSTWADILIRKLADVDFSLLAIMMHPYLTMKFDLPANVVRMIQVPLWGTEEPAEYISELKFSEIFVNKLKPDLSVRKTFKEILETIVLAIYSENPNLEELGGTMHKLHDIFAEHDYRTLFRAEWFWRFFYRLFLEVHEFSPEFSLHEFRNGYSMDLLSDRVEAGGFGIALESAPGTFERLNELVRCPRFFDIWLARCGALEITDDIALYAESTREFRSRDFSLLTLRKQREVLMLNRLLLELTFPEACPKMVETSGDPPTVYDAVESLRWLYRFFITLLAPLPEADVYHSSAAAFCGLPCILAKQKYGSRFLLTEHGIYVREQYLFASRERMPFRSKEFLMGLVGLVAKLNYRYADRISPVCDYNKRWELRYGAPEENIRVIYNGIDTRRFRRITVERDSRPTVVMIARIDPLKDIETFILTCAEVRKRFPAVLFKLFGPKLNEEYFLRCMDLVKDLGLKNSFCWAGETSMPELAINEGDVVLLTSISEAFPFSVIEGMACEKVIVSSDVGGAGEVLEGYGFVVKPRNHLEFAEKIVYALEHPAESAEIGVEARQRIKSGFRTDDMVRNYRETYYELAGRHGHV